MSSQRSLSRREASDYLLERWGIRHAPGTLATLACVGGGPAYRLARKLAIYEPPALDEYAKRIISAPAVTRTEHAARDPKLAIAAPGAKVRA